ncbi:MAG: HEAT repeat domain-containing protein [Deltaproteobacteria bacterium]|nr:HEAT repeat domain-containing protein [Deltaproteobacteria bacterium]
MFGPAPLPRTFEAARRDLGSPKPSVRADAVRDLCRHGAEHRDEVVRLLGAAVQDEHEDDEVRATAAVALADLEAEEAAPALVAAAGDPSPQVRQMALLALGELRAPSALPVVREALRGARPDVRFQAVIAFARICRDHDLVVAELLHASFDEDERVCHIGLRMAEELGAAGPDGGAGAVDPRIAARALGLLDHASPGVRALAAVVLARTGREEADGVLVEIAEGKLRPEQAEDEAAAIELCGERGIRRARAALERRAFPRLLGRRDPFAWHARIALAALGHARAIAAILGELRAAGRERRNLAVVAAGRARLRQARPAILAMQGRPERADQEAVRLALAALEAGP